MDLYGRADSVIKDMNRMNLKAFDRLKLMKRDELNVIRQVEAVYDASVRTAKRKYYEIAVEAYIVALLSAKLVDNRKAHEMAEDTITEEWILAFLEEPDPVMLYAFLPETDRKKQRLVEALSVAKNRDAEIDKALRYWTLQMSQFADNAVYRARLDAFRDAGVEYVRWVTQDDERVCDDCDDLDDQVFPIDEVPPPQHPRCRCYIVPA